jgi:hypothetical protein
LLRLGFTSKSLFCREVPPYRGRQSGARNLGYLVALSTVTQPSTVFPPSLPTVRTPKVTLSPISPK